MDDNKIDTKVEEQPVQAQAKTPQALLNQTNVESDAESPQQIDWRKFKEARKIERQQKEAAEKNAAEERARADALKAALEAVVNKPQANNEQPEETEDDRIQKKIDAALVAERKRVDDDRRKREQAEFPQRLASAHPDFDSVCSAENIDYLEYHYPEVAAGFKHAPDSFEKWSNVYKAIKRFLPNANSNKDQKKAEKNMNKPQAMSAPGATQTGDGAPMMLDDKRKADNWKRMQQRMKGV